MFSRVVLLTIALLYCEVRALMTKTTDVVLICIAAILMSYWMGGKDNGQVR